MYGSLCTMACPLWLCSGFPLKESNGKANLHHGAIGVGIDLENGVTLKGVHHDRAIVKHPDTGESIKGIALPTGKRY